MGLNESHIRQIGKNYIVEYRSYGINKSFKTLEEAIEYRNEMQDYVKKQDLKKIDVRNKRLQYPYNVCDMLYSKLSPAKRLKIDYTLVEENAKETIGYIVERFVKTESHKEAFYKHVNGMSCADIGKERGCSRQAVNEQVLKVYQTILDNINYILNPGCVIGPQPATPDLDIKSFTLLSIGLDSRYCSRLRNAGINTVEDAMSKTYFEISRMHFVGEKTAIHLYETLAKNGLFMEIGDTKDAGKC